MNPKLELKINDKLKEERNISNSVYAPVVIKTIVYAFISLICVAFIGFLTAKIWPH